MIPFVSKISDIAAGNVVALIETEADISQLSFLNLDTTIVSHIKKNLKKDDSSFQEYVLGGRKYEKLFIFINKEDSYLKKVNFFGKHFPKIEGNLALFASSLEAKKDFYQVCELSRYRFQRYKSEKKESFTQVFLSDESEALALQDMQALIENIYLARDLGETPACDLTPEIFVEMVKKTKFKNIKVKVLTYRDIQKKGLGLIEAVGKGSENKPALVILEHMRDKSQEIHGIVGKGITFDTGGNQIIPGDSMYDMKGDMGGAAVTFALMKELDRHNIDKNIVACLCLAENVVSSNAYKPSDILTSYSGKTVEVIHTDAEGRLVLADGISYLGQNYKTTSMMSIATLTGACMVALGFRYAGIMGTDRTMLDKLLAYSKDHTEQYVELPFADHFLEKTKSQIADYKNLDRGVFAGASMGGAFLSNFCVNNEAYTHIDIAGAYINEADAYGKMPKGMTGFGVESLSEIFRSL